jgi:hypothetical protein
MEAQSAIAVTACGLWHGILGHSKKTNVRPRSFFNMKDLCFFHSRASAFARCVAAASACAAVLAGCGGSAPLFTSDGRPTTVVQCSASSAWENCTEHARAICGGDIDVLQQSDADGQHKLLFACKAK